MLLDQITVDHALNVHATIDEETVVLDHFAGGGVYGEAAIGLERRYDPALAEVC